MRNFFIFFIYRNIKMNIKEVKKAVAKYHKENYDLAISDQNTRKNYIEFFESILDSLGQINDTPDNVDNLKTYIEKKYDFIDTLETVLSSIQENRPIAEEEVSMVSRVLTAEQKQLIKDRIPEEFENPAKKSKFWLNQTPKYSDAPVGHNKKKKTIDVVVQPEVKEEPHVIPFKVPKVKSVKVKVAKVKEPHVIPFKVPKVKIVKVKVPKVKEPHVIPFKEPKVKIVKVKVPKVKDPKVAKVKEPKIVTTRTVKVVKAGAKFKVKMTDAEKKVAKAVAMKKYRQKLKDENPKLFLNKQRDEKRAQRSSKKIKIIAAPQEIPLELLIEHVNPKQTVGSAKNVADLKFLRKYFLS